MTIYPILKQFLQESCEAVEAQIALLEEHHNFIERVSKENAIKFADHYYEEWETDDEEWDEEDSCEEAETEVGEEENEDEEDLPEKPPMLWEDVVKQILTRTI